jgi:hypothetical protein
VIELKPKLSDSPKSGFETPENEIIESALEIYDGFLVYFKTFIKNVTDKNIIKECRELLNTMLQEVI